jgi:uncharacterized protein (TIGR03435 family)
LFAQAPSALLHFEIASVKPAFSPAELRDKGLRPKQPVSNPGRFERYNISISALVREAYRVESDQNIVGPDWLNTTFLDVVAKLPDGADANRVPDMLQSLLADRIKLRVHWGTKEQKGYILTVGAEGPKLKPASADAGSPYDRLRGDGQRTILAAGKTANGWTAYSLVGGVYVIDGARITISDLLAKSLFKREVDGPVVDRRGLTGLYDLSLTVPGTWQKRSGGGAAQGVGGASEPAGVSLSKSLEKLGLKLEKGTISIKQLVVDAAEKSPIAN